MRIVIDLQGAQTESRFRGIGRYSLSLAKAIVRNRGDHEVVIALSGLFPETIEPIRNEFDGLLAQENIRVWYALGPVKECEAGNEWRREAAELIREAFLASLDPDVIYITSLFEGYVDDAVTSIGVLDTEIPVFTSLYDLIPLLNPDLYLRPNPDYEQYYRRKIDFIKRPSGLFAISEFTKQESIDNLEYNDSLIINISTAITSNFKVMALSGSQIVSILGKFKITSDFILYTGGSDGRKNLTRLINAYAKLSPKLRDTHQLVFAGKMPEGDIHNFKQQAKVAGLKKNDLIFTGYISDDKLVQLYNLCKLYVFPSWHEGFGLPTLEAMSCGAPVIASNTTSLPEVIGNKEALFNPFSEKEMTAKITQALTNESFRQHLIKSGLERSKQFSWDKSAKLAIEEFEKIYKLKENSSKAIFQTALLITELAKINTIDIPSETDLIETAKCIDLNSKTILRYKQTLGMLTWRIEGPFDSSYSLALLNRETALALRDLKQSVALHSTEGPGDFEPQPEFLEHNPLIKEMHRKSHEITSSSADIISRNLYPPRVGDMQSPIKFLHNYAWEESGFPQKWVNDFNANLDGMSCTSQYVKKIMIDNGVSIPMQVSGNGVDHWERIVATVDYTIKAKHFKFLHVSSCFPRKGVDCLLKAYRERFTSSDNVTLIIKTFANPHNEVHQWLAESRMNESDYPDVLIIEDDLNDSDLKALYTLCDVLVAPSRAEGFGLPMAEAMLSGLPVITTAWSGQMDFCNEENSWLIDFDFERANTHFDLFLSAWANPKIDSLGQAMLEAYHTSHELRKLKALAGRELLLKDFTWSNVTKNHVNTVSRFLELKEIDSPKVAWLSTWNTKCGIATYSQHLIDNLSSREVVVFAPKSENKIELDGANCVRNWNIGKVENGLRNVTNEIGRGIFNTIVLQFNYGFYNHIELSQFINDNHTDGQNIIIIMHATINPSKADKTNFNLEFILPALRLCNRILVHSVDDLNRLKNIGLVDNVALFPHGVLNYAEQSASVKESEFPLIASYGFCLPHKGLEELIDAVAILRKQGTPVRLRLVNAEYPDPISTSQVQKIKLQIENLELGNLVEFNHKFLDDKQSLAFLSEAELIVFAYQETEESSSAAVRYGLATKRPVAVTPLSIFNDISGAVFRLSGKDSTSIASSIESIIKSLSSDSEEAKKIQNSADKWRSEFNYKSVSRRLEGIFRSLLINN